METKLMLSTLDSNSMYDAIAVYFELLTNARNIKFVSFIAHGEIGM